MRKIKLFVYSCLLGISALPVQAKVITQSQAQALAAKYVSVGNGSKQQTFSAARKSGQQDAPSFYAFNDSKGKGFVLIAGDDCVNPVLGYSPSGKIDTDNLPPALEAWLQDVSSYINSKRENGNGMAMTASDAEQGSTPSVVVAPLIKTKWYQMAPYNDMVPTIGGKRCPTGCVATAMAQVMKYYKWPMKGTNSIKYDTPDYDQKTCDVDFSQSVYDWDNMLDVYGTRSEPDNFTCSEANRKAVAQLMRDAGAAVHMLYGTEGSGANAPEIVSAATYYLGYDAQFYHKNDYTMKQWLSLIKGTLDDGCPLVYCGDTKMLPMVGTRSHCFVVDGYDTNNYLHVNWGWAGDCDGYYSFYKFGANAASYFSENMDFVKMTPNKTGVIEWDTANPLRINASASKISVNGQVSNKGEILTCDVDNFNADLDINLISLVWKLYQGNIDLGYTTENGEFTSLVNLKDVAIKDDENGFTQDKVRFHIGSADIKNLADGSYQLTILSKRTNSGMSVNGAPIVPAISDAQYSLMLIKENSKVSIGFLENHKPHLTAKSTLSWDKDEYDITDMSKAKIQVANETDEDFYGIPLLIVTNNSTDSTTYYSLLEDPIYLYASDSTVMSFDIPISSNAGFLEGMNKVMLGQYLDDKVTPLKGIEPVTIKVNHNNDKIPHLEAYNLELMIDYEPITDDDNLEVDYHSSIFFSTDLNCSVNTIPEYCMMPVVATIKMDYESNIGDQERNKIENVEKNVNFNLLKSFTLGDVGTAGTISVQYTPMFDTKPHYVQYNGKDLCFKFKVVDTTTGIKDITSGNKATETMRFDVMGCRINTPAKGLNLIKLSDGTVKKVIVK